MTEEGQSLSPEAPPLGTGGPQLLWDNGHGTASLWRLDAPDTLGAAVSTPRRFGPFAGWTVRALAAGPEGMTYLLWTGPSRMASLWSVDESAEDESAEDGHTRHWEFGPYAGWEARALAVGQDSVLRVLWAGTGGAAALWALRPEEAPAVLDYGPFPGWTPVSLAAGAGGWTYLLWTREDGAASVWAIGADGVALPREYGPYDSWHAVAVAADRQGAVRLLWASAGGYASLWDLPSAGQGAAADDPAPDERPQKVYGPFAGWTASSVTLDGDGAAHLLWRYNGGGLASVWRVDAAGEVTHVEHGPYAGWVPVGLSAP